MTCATCGGCGFKTTGPAPEVMVFCHCPAGVGKRLYSTREAMKAYRTSGSEPVIVPLPPDSPDWSETESMAAAITPVGSEHNCAVCSAPLLAGQPCGAWCLFCNQAAAKAKLEFKREDWRITWAAVIGFAAGCAVTVLLAMLL